MNLLGGKKSAYSLLFQTTDFTSIAAAAVCVNGVKKVSILPPPFVLKGCDWVYSNKIQIIQCN